MSENILDVKGLTKDYGDFVLDKLTFAVPKGVIMGLVGENGAGKSTTINCILNEILKTDGNIEIFGKDYLSEEIEIKDKIGVVFDENHSVLVSSHITSDLEKVADYITFLHKGKLVFSHLIDELVDNYGVVSCGALIFDNMDKSELIAYQDWKDGEITQQDYRDMKADYERQAAALSDVLERLTTERAELANGVDNEHPALVAFMKYQNIETLNREILIELVDHIKVYENGNIKIKFKFADELRKIAEYIEINTSEIPAVAG